MRENRRVAPSKCLVLCGLIVACSAISAHSQDSSDQKQSTPPKSGSVVESGLTVSSSPEGALVKLKGVSTLVGLSPVFFGQGLPGYYQLEVSSPGYETYQADILVTNTSVTAVAIDLKRRSRTKAAFRSMIWPGWGQFYSERPTKGAMLSVLAVAAGVSLAVAETNYQDKRDVYDVAFADLVEAQVAGSLDDLAPLQTSVKFAQADAFDAESYRRVAIGAVVAVWGISFLDAVLFFPEPRKATAPRTLTLSPDVDFQTGKTGLNLSINF